MKVRFVSTYPPKKCGVADHTKHLADSLKKIGIKPEIVEIKKSTTANPFYFLKLAQMAAKGTSEGDIIHIQFHLSIFGKLFKIIPGFYITLFLVCLKLFTKAKIIIAMHDAPTISDAKEKGKKGIMFYYYYKFLNLFLRSCADKIITHSESGKKIYLNEWKFAKDKVITLPLGLPIDIKILDKTFCKKKLGYFNKKILLILGYIKASRNYDQILESLKRLNKNVILLLIGEVQLKKHQIVYKNILKKIDELGLKERVHLLGFVDNSKIPFYLNATDIGLDPNSGGFGDFVSSTMAMQLSYQIPILATNIQPFENLKKRTKCIETYDKNDVDDLTKKIKDLLSSPSKINYLKNQTKRYWKENNWDEIGKKTKKLYLSLFE